MDNYFRYSEEKCPICEEQFTEQDDIVVCPICGTPHHRACYNQNGECGNEHKHNEGYRWAPKEKYDSANDNSFVTEPMTEDGSEELPPFAPMYNPFKNLPGNIEDDIPTLEAAAFIQSGSYRYCQKFFFEKSGKKTFNWAAFIFAPYWFFYRKMYKLGIIFTALLLLLSATTFIPAVKVLNKSVNAVYDQYAEVESREELSTIYSAITDAMRSNKTGTAILLSTYAVQLAIGIVAGAIANKEYYKHIIKKIRDIHNTSQTPELAGMRTRKEGGVSIIFPLAAIFLIEGVNTFLQTFIK